MALIKAHKTFSKRFICVFSILILISYVSSFNSSKDVQIKLFSNALNSIITNHYLKEKLGFDFLVSDRKCSEFASAIITNVIKNNLQLLDPYTIQFIDEARTKEIELSRSTIIFSEQDFTINRMLGKVKMKNIDYLKFHHYIVVRKISKPRMNIGLTEITETDTVLYSSFLVQETPDFIVVKAVFLFDDNYCDAVIKPIIDLSSVIIPNKSIDYNFYDRSKVKQYNFCEFKIFKEDFEIGTRSIFIDFLFDILSKKFNFTIEYIYRSQQDTVPFLFKYYIRNLDTLTRLYENTSSLGSTGFQFVLVSVHEMALLVSIGEPYGMFDKLLIPFDLATWLAILFSFVVAFIVILCLKLLDIGVQRFVFGTFVTTPVLNVVAVFFGQDQTILPGRNFARYILMMYILFCIIIRTAYQSLQYDLMLTVSTLNFSNSNIVKLSM